MRRSIVFLIVLGLAASLPHVEAQEYVFPSELSFIVYGDGYVAVDYTVDVDPTMVRVNVSLFGSMYLDVLIEDQDGLPLDYSATEGGLTVDTLASISALISYVTTDLTGKEGQVWSFSVATPISSTVLLPEDSTMVDYSEDPLEVGSIDGKVLLTMPAGEFEISYTVGAVGSREHALAVINDAEDTIEAIKATGVLTPNADEHLELAYAAYDVGLYAQAEQLATQSKAFAEEASALASEASQEIEAAIEAIAQAEGESRTEGLDTAERELQEAEDAYDLGEYSTARVLAEDAQASAQSAEKKSAGSNTLLYAGLAVVAVGLGAAYFMRGRSQRPVEEPPATFDLEKMFDAHPHLRIDDKEVIRFLAQNRGEAFSAEVRDRFDIPRTSLWRMIRRLEGEGIFEVETIGGQSLIRLNPRYREGDTGG